MRVNLYRIPAVLLSLFLHGFAGAQDLLDPALAFKFSAQAMDAGTLEVRYRIADGYYMYRDKFKFAVEPASMKLGAAQLPRGDVHNDEFFGKVETYRKELRIRLPFTRDAAADKLKLAVTSQGCADVGVCYVPQVQTAEIKLAALAPASGASAPVAASTPFAEAARPRGCSPRAACGLSPPLFSAPASCSRSRLACCR